MAESLGPANAELQETMRKVAAQAQTCRRF